MGLFDKLFGRSRSKEDTPRDAGQVDRVMRKLPDAGRLTSTSAERPFDIVSEAVQAWQDGEITRAERLFKEGIAAYRRGEPDGLDFALGRYGAFLIELDRKDEAMGVLEEAVSRKTTIPAIWSDYVRLIADRGDVDAFKEAIERMAASVSYRIEPEFLLAHARRAQREDATAFAEAVAHWVVERATGEGDMEGRWAAIGDLGRILERTGRLEEAMRLWAGAFDEGSVDPDTAARLSMHLERAKDYAASIAVIRQALNRGLPANAEESLRKRLARCEAKTAKTSSTQTRASADVPAYSIRRAAAPLDPLFQLRIKPTVKDLELVGDTVRCLLVSKAASTLVDVGLGSGAEVRRVENLPVLGDTWFAPDGHGIGIRRRAAVGKGPTLLIFLDADGRVAAESSVSDATSEIALGPDLWYVGCRNGFLYGFGFDGKQRWAWKTPGSDGYQDNVYFRPCPYYVASSRSFAAIASMENIYAVGADGRTLWHAALPNERQTRWSYTIPLGRRVSDDAYSILGLSPSASRDEVKSAYRRLALATHPDRNPDDADAAAKFCEVQAAYERILTGVGGRGTSGGAIAVTVEINGMGPTASFLAANAEGVVVGSSQGRVYLFDSSGRFRQAHVLGDGPVRAALRPDGTLGVAWCSDALMFFRQNRIINAAEAMAWPRALTMLGENVVLWRGNQVQIMDPDGRLLWSVEFSKNLTGVATHGNTLVCAAGVLAAFRQRGV